MGFRVLLCVDGSTFSEGARAVALQLARSEPNTELTVLHVVNVRSSSGNIVKDIPGHLGFEPAVVSRETLDHHVRQGEDLLAEVSREAELAGVVVRSVCDQGAVADRIGHWARHVDLVVMGLRGRTEEQYPGQGGANLESVLSRVMVPVLFVGRTHERITGFAMGYDGSDGAVRALKATSLLAGSLGVPVHAVYVTPDGRGGEVLDECEALFPGVEVHPHVLMAEDAHAALVAHAEQLDANVLSVGFRGRSRLKSFLYGSTANHILMNTDLMVLVAH